ncbi:hypothetical protein C8F01DRAFT_1371708 [Mycena amicta]|nr:hypothetical protein C8F01DRAFT_1371708 [Mycena amicta]
MSLSIKCHLPFFAAVLLASLIPTTSATLASDSDGRVIPAFAPDHKPSPRPKAEDFAEGPRDVILNTCTLFEVAIITEAGFPPARAATTADGTGGSTHVASDMPTPAELAERCWVQANAAAESNYALTKPVVRIVTSRTSRIRGDFICTFARPIFQTGYGFRDATSNKRKKQNKALYSELVKEKAFLYKDTKKRECMFENKTALSMIQQAYFNNGAKSLGVVHEDSFMPITLATLAMVYTAIQFCLEEWKTGCRIKAPFTGKAVASKYYVMLVDLLEWDSVNPSFSHKIRTKWAKKFRKATGIDDATLSMEDGIVTEDLKEKIRRDQEGRTGETDSENDSDSGEENEDDD